MASPAVDPSPVLDPLQHIANRGYGRARVFNDFLSLCLLALQGRDGDYLEIVDRYSDDRDMDHPRGERTIDLFAEAFGTLQAETGTTGQDVIGAAYEEWGETADEFGQYFTPHHLCEFKAETMIGDADPDGNNDGNRICDPTCGSGRLLISAAQKDPRGTFVGVDVDSRCARMAALNFAMLGVDGLVVQANTLTAEVITAWETYGGSNEPPVRELKDDGLEAVEDFIVHSSWSETGKSESPDERKGGAETAANPDQERTTHINRSLDEFKAG